MQRHLIGAGLFVLSSLAFVAGGTADPLPTEIGDL